MTGHRGKTVNIKTDIDALEFLDKMDLGKMAKRTAIATVEQIPLTLAAATLARAGVLD